MKASLKAQRFWWEMIFSSVSAVYTDTEKVWAALICLYCEWQYSALIFGGESSGQSWVVESPEQEHRRKNTFFFRSYYYLHRQHSASGGGQTLFPSLFFARCVLLWEKEEYKNGHYIVCGVWRLDLFSVCVGGKKGEIVAIICKPYVSVQFSLHMRESVWWVCGYQHWFIFPPSVQSATDQWRNIFSPPIHTHCYLLTSDLLTWTPGFCEALCTRLSISWRKQNDLSFSQLQP